MDTLVSMRLFIQVIQTGSFSAAGREAGLSPASVFRHINALETALGARLFNRTSRKLSLTEAGDLYAKRLDHILAEIQETNAEITQLQQVPRGVLRVHSRVSLGAQLLAPALPAFLARYPELRLDLRLSDREVDMVQENVDLSIGLGRMRDSSLIVRRLATSPRIVCASPAYLATRPAPERPEDLLAHNCLVYRNDAQPPTWRFLRDGQLTEVRVAGGLLTDHAEVVRLGVLGGLGVALLPEWSIGRDLQEGRLRPLLPDYEASPMDLDHGIYVVMQRSRQRSIKVRLFVDFLLTLFQTRETWAGPAEAGPPQSDKQAV